MAIHRVPTEDQFKMFDQYREDVLFPNEWAENDGLDRVDDPTWIQRYEYEARIINSICQNNNYKKVLELGSGPGVLSQFVIKLNPTIEYSCVDKPQAKKAFDNRNYVGKFYVKDLMNEFDISDLDTDYDLIVANDFLEHIANPSDIMAKCRKITKNNSSFFISVPNWRMGHWFIYRGLFDYDNFIYFCKVHGYEPIDVYESILRCHPYPKLSSEETLPDDLISSWNWYFETKKILLQ